MNVRDLLIVVIVICVLAALFGRAHLPAVYPGSLGGVLVLVLVLGLLLGWFR